MNVKKFRRSKKYYAAYNDIGKTNQQIQNLLIEAETYERYGNTDEYTRCTELIDKYRKYITDNYSAEEYDLDYISPMVSGLYVEKSNKNI